jgi:hypothetical protein
MAKSGIIPPKPQQSNAAADDWVNGGTATAVASAGKGSSEPTKRMTVDIPQSLHRRVMFDCLSQGVKFTTELRKMIEDRWPEKTAQ